MGIRFYCPNGHKLNVKSFQAGRRGICPFCGAKIIIPSQSTRKSSKADRAGRGGAAEAEHEIVLQPEPVQHAPPASVPEAGAGNRMGSPGGAAPSAPAPRGTPVMAQPLELRASAGAIPVQRPLEPAPLVASGLKAAPVAGVLVRPVQPAETQPAAQPGLPTAAPAQAPPGPAASSERPDPLAEAGSVVWYVRPPSGGQFGPATSDVMRTWITEGRVSADSLVWREGWRDWQEASGVFPQLGAAKNEFGIDAIGASDATSRVGLGKTRSPRSRRQETVRQASIITLLVLAVAVLVGVFVWVVFFYPA